MKLATSLVFALACSAVFASSPHPRTLTLEDRVQARKAIEQVYWNHRIWPHENRSAKPALSAVMSDESIRLKVEDDLRKSSALEKFWQRPITADQLQAEMDRMAKETRDGATLQDLYHALGDDPFLIAETLARPTLVDRLLRSWYAGDSRFHGALRRKAESALTTCTSVDCMKSLGGEYREMTWKALAEQDVRTSGEKDVSIVLDAGEWKQLVAHLESTLGTSVESAPAGRWSRLQETSDAFALTAVRAYRDGEITTATMAWPKQTFDAWWDDERSRIGAANDPADRDFDLPAVLLTTCAPDTWTPMVAGFPDARQYHSAVWTGTEMIVWGGYNGSYLNTGGRYSPATDTWTPTSTGANVPSARQYHTAVWTGAQMIVWGGDNGAKLNSGGRYDPSTDTWSPTSTGANVPAVRTHHTAVWTGTQMIVWGGNNDAALLNTGGRYDPSTDSWLPTSTDTNVPTARGLHTAVWTGTQMIVWGGVFQNTGGRYDPSTDSWSPTSTGANVPSGRSQHSAVWTGTQMVVWGGLDPTAPGSNLVNTGGRYDPGNDSWSATSTGANVPAARNGHTAVWTGTQMIVWGGSNPNTGGRYDPSTDIWLTTSMGNTPLGRSGHVAVWTGSEMIVWGGSNGSYLNSGGRYNPAIDGWVATSWGANVPISDGGWPVWTGAEMILWGGFEGSGSTATYLNSGGRYNAATNTWSPTSRGANAPTARSGTTNVWTGTEMIVWGGYNGSYLNSGGRYNPSTDSWAATSTGTGAPAGRVSHVAVWTGSQMIVWGGYSTGIEHNTGGRYDPSTDSWTPTSTGANVPTGREFHTVAVWTGTEMIVWGGNPGGYPSTWLNTGGRYNPSTDSWTATSTGANVPAGRDYHAVVWTGTQMIVWGGFGSSGFNTGGRYDPSIDSWTPTSTGANAPSARYSVGTVWTGSRMIVWGGISYSTGTYFSTGGRYDPSSDTWTATSTGANVPTARAGPAAAWTGSQMIIWGGGNSSSSTQTGSLYCVCAGGATVYRDADGDGYGNPTLPFSPCDGPIPAGYVADNTDCNDTNAAIHPGAAEGCNGLDDDCNGIVDDGGAVASCNDANICTTDSCNGVSGCAHTNNTNACDDGNACTSGDTCGDGVCKPGTPVAPPTEVDGLLLSGQAGTALAWNGQNENVVYDVASSTVYELRADGTATAACLSNDVAGTSSIDDRADPAPGNGYYYLVRAQSTCGTGSYGADSAGTERAAPSACP